MKTTVLMHNVYSRNNHRVKSIIREYGMAGYGIFWTICEIIVSCENKEKCTIDRIINELALEKYFSSHEIEIAKRIIWDSHLFRIIEYTVYINRENTISYPILKAL